MICYIVYKLLQRVKSYKNVAKNRYLLKQFYILLQENNKNYIIFQ